MDGLTYMWEAELTGTSDGWMDWVRNKGNITDKDYYCFFSISQWVGGDVIYRNWEPGGGTNRGEGKLKYQFET